MFWLALLAIVGIAAAPDFTERLMWESMAPGERATLQRDGVLHVPSQYGPPTPITLALIEDGRNHLVLDAEIPLDALAVLRPVGGLVRKCRVEALSVTNWRAGVKP